MTSTRGLPLWSDHTAFARRHARWILVLLVAGLTSGVAWALLQPATFSATASVALSPVPKYLTSSIVDIAAPEVTIDTDAQLLRSPEVLGAVGDILGTTAAEAGTRLSMTASPNSHVLHVTVRSSSPDLAAAAADGAVAAFTGVRRNALGALRHDQLRQLRQLLVDQEKLLAREQSKRLVISSTDQLFDDVLGLQTALDELLLARSKPAQVVRAADPPVRADYSNTEVPVVSGAMLGLLGACLLGAGRDRLQHLRRKPAPSAHPSQLSGRPWPVTITLREDAHHAG